MGKREMVAWLLFITNECMHGKPQRCRFITKIAKRGINHLHNIMAQECDSTPLPPCSYKVGTRVVRETQALGEIPLLCPFFCVE